MALHYKISGSKSGRKSYVESALRFGLKLICLSFEWLLSKFAVDYIIVQQHVPIISRYSSNLRRCWWSFNNITSPFCYLPPPVFLLSMPFATLLLNKKFYSHLPPEMCLWTLCSYKHCFIKRWRTIVCSVSTLLVWYDNVYTNNIFF